jgi:exodeoxyribonuclease-3
MRLRICTWNVNSVRLRAEQAARFVAEQAPDVLCLQEIKCREGEFPREAFVEMGLPHLKIAGQKGWHGVAIASRLPLEDAPALDVCREGHARCVGATVAGVEIHNFYIPAGGDVPDRSENPKFDHKLDFYEKLTAELARRDPKAPLAIVGDLNVAPGENDVWNHKYMSKVVSHTPVEVEAMWELVELPRAGLPPVQPRPAPGPHPGDAGPEGRRVPPGLGGRPHPRRRPRMGTALRPRASVGGSGVLGALWSGYAKGPRCGGTCWAGALFDHVGPLWTCRFGKIDARRYLNGSAKRAAKAREQSVVLIVRRLHGASL